MDLKVSPTTAHKALAALKNAGLLTSRPGVGMVVAAPATPANEVGRQTITAHCLALLREADTYGLGLEEVVETLRQTHQRMRPNDPTDHE